MEDRWLVLRCKAGSADALRRIWDKYGHDLLVLAVSMVKDVHLAEDILQDVFAAFIENMERFKLTGSLKAYLATCVANRARNCLRDMNKVGTQGAENRQNADNDIEPSITVSINEELERLSAALEQLPYEQREVINLHMHMGISLRAIACTLDLPANTVKSRYRYGMDKLRILLNGEVES